MNRKSNKKTFDENQWQNLPESENTPIQKTVENESSVPKDNGTTFNQVNAIIEKIETTGTDIAPEYGDWRNVGFAFADEFGEAGRELYHRISKFYTDYTREETDIQYNRCMKSKGHGVTIGTFFYWAYRFGIDHHTLGKQKTTEKTYPNAHVRKFSYSHPRSGINNPPNYELFVEKDSSIKTFPNSIFTHLPSFFKQVVDVCTTDQERDLMLLGSLITLGTSLYNVSGIYDQKRVFPNLYLFVAAPASSGKGRLLHCRSLLQPIHQQIRKENKTLWEKYYKEMKQKESQSSKVKLENKPPEQLMFLPANTSATGMFQLLADNPDGGLIFETEGDTLTNTFKSDYGNYSDGFRKAFHHEPISFFRRMDREYVHIENPRLSAILSGTPKQVSTLIPNLENGLFSRFIFYTLDANTNWKDVFERSHTNSLDDFYLEMGKQWLEIHNTRQKQQPITFQYTPEQQQYFNIYLGKLHEKVVRSNKLSMLPTVRRLGIMAFRISMILSTVRISLDKEIPQQLYCSNEDFQITLSMLEPLLNNALDIKSQLISNLPLLKNRKQNFLQNLPKDFNRKDYLTLADDLHIPRKTADRYIQELLKDGLIIRLVKDQYSINTQ